MNEGKSATGSCLCNKIKISVKALNPGVGACHCNTCRKWTGGPLLAVDCGTDVSFDGDQHIQVYDSSEWAQRGFCKNCGTHLFYRLKESSQYIMPAGLFDDSSDLLLDHQIFIDQKPAWYDFANDTKNMTGEEVFAQYASPE